MPDMNAAYAVTMSAPRESRRWRTRVMRRILESVARFDRFRGVSEEPEAGITVVRDLRYGRHPVAHRLDLYRPEGLAGPLPVLLYIHGGAFMFCSKDTHCDFARVNALGARYLVVNVNYRLAPEYRFPAALVDVCRAYRWVVRHIHRHGGDPSRIIVGGESAGGNLALGLAIAATYRRPERYARKLFALGQPPIGVMPIVPYLQASNPQRHAGSGRLMLMIASEIAHCYLGSCERTRQPTALADPVCVMEGPSRPLRPFPPVFAGVGTADPCCADVQRLELACRRIGVPIEAHYFPGEIHAFHALRWRPAARRFWRECFAFMRRLGAEPARPASPDRSRRRLSAAA